MCQFYLSVPSNPKQLLFSETFKSELGTVFNFTQQLVSVINFISQVVLRNWFTVSVWSLAKREHLFTHNTRIQICMHAHILFFHWLSVPSHLEILAGCSSHAIRSKRKIYTHTHTQKKSIQKHAIKAYEWLHVRSLASRSVVRKQQAVDTPLVTQTDMW